MTESQLGRFRGFVLASQGILRDSCLGVQPKEISKVNLDAEGIDAMIAVLAFIDDALKAPESSAPEYTPFPPAEQSLDEINRHLQYMSQMQGEIYMVLNNRLP